MVWVPGVDEVPMGTGPNDAQGRVTLTVEAKGDCTKALLALPVGARIGVRGPYGRGFTLPPATSPLWPRAGSPAAPASPAQVKPQRLAFVGGGTGIAPMARGAQQAAALGHDVQVVSGARRRDLLLLHPYLEAEAEAGRITYLPCTDDGSFGFAGFTTARLEPMLAGLDRVAACGPEAMMVKAVAMAKNAGVAAEASLERYMKCAIGICDACTVGPGLRLCMEGPVLGADALADVQEFGVGHRDAAGILHPW
jgi:dihydroorotate dehydrogenase electron transfer subunit